jgi:hypothetical protein
MFGLALPLDALRALGVATYCAASGQGAGKIVVLNSRMSGRNIDGTVLRVLFEWEVREQT